MARDSIDDIIYITKLKPFVNHLKEKQKVKKWLLHNGRHLEKIKGLKRCIVNIPKNLSYDYLMNEFPMQAIKYIKNDSKFKDIIFKINKKRNPNIKQRYYYIYSLLLLFPKNQILKLQLNLKNNKNSIFNNICNNGISKKQLDLAYKQLYILLNGELIPKYSTFNVDDNSCNDLINDYLNIVITQCISDIKQILKK